MVVKEREDGGVDGEGMRRGDDGGGMERRG